MVDRPINNDDLITIIRPQGGNKPEYRTIEELNNKFSKEEQSELTTLQAQVGDYDPTSTGSTITADLATLQGEVETTTTGLIDRTKVLEKAKQTALPGTPTMVTYDEGTLTIGTKPAEGATVTIGTTVYKFRASALGAGAKATGTLDLTAEAPHDGDFVTLGLITYTFKTALTPTAGEVLIEATSADSVLNLVAAASGGAGAGTKYATGTTASPNVVCAAVANTMTVEYATVGFLGNSFDTLTGNGEGAMTHGSFATATLIGGIDAQAAFDVYDGGDIANSIINLKKAINLEGTAGTHYGTGTTIHPTVTIPAITEGGWTATTLKVQSKTAGDIAGIALDETLADGSWSDTETSGGVNGTAAVQGKLMVDENSLYVAVDACTTTNSNGWKRVLLDYVDPVLIDLSSGTDYTIPTSLPPSIVIVTETDGSDGDIYLPPAIGSMNKIMISIQKAANNITIQPAVDPGTDTINTASSYTLNALATITLLDYANGKWLVIA
jgi:hypothetical protein